jgi:glycosyltransferase involved in cell wall biosynthesis
VSAVWQPSWERRKELRTREKSEKEIICPDVSIIIPARNEESNLAQCLSSLVDQKGVSFELFVVDDHSTDKTALVAQGFASVHLVSARALLPGWTGKANAIQTAVPLASGKWFLFTDADTTHTPGSLGRAIAEATEHEVSLLSYSPKQIAGTFWERAVQPVIFSELAREFDYDDISRPGSSRAAANGQYILVTRTAYEAVGEHEIVKGSFIEDVDLASAIKRVGTLRFRYAPDAVSTRMYKGIDEVIKGWTKNATMLFPSPEKLILLKTGEAFLLIAGLPLALALFAVKDLFAGIVAFFSSLLSYVALARRLSRAGWKLHAVPFSVFGVAIFAYILARSYANHYITKTVEWKGRSYRT